MDREDCEPEIIIIKEEKMGSWKLPKSTKVGRMWNKWGHSKMTLEQWLVGGNKKYARTQLMNQGIRRQVGCDRS